MANSTPSLSIEDYHVGIICALASEMAAVEGMLDEEHKNNIVQNTQDNNAYVFGRIHPHNVVIACLPAGIDGLAAAATVAKDMSRTFTQLRFGLLVGIGGGIPNLDRGVDIRLGDIVVSEPSGTMGGVVQYEKGKRLAEGAWERKGMLNAPPTVILTALQRLKARHLRHDSVVSSLVATMLQQNPKMIRTGYGFPGQEHDCLRSDLQRQNGNSSDVVSRSLRETNDPEIHYGVIASGNQVIGDEVVRNQLSHEFGALCVEMEAAGLMNNFPCIVIRGICDYADRHKNDRWHEYAAATAAAYAKELLSYVSPEQTRQEAPIQQICGILQEQLEQSRAQYVQQEVQNERQETRYQNDKQRDCHRTFKTSNYEEHKNINPDRAPDTCRWLLNHEKFQEWRNNPHNDLLWISADPGCGKSVLSKSLIDQDLRGKSTDIGCVSDTVTICYFFFRENDEQGSLATALCAILHQLFFSQPQLIRHALLAWEKNGGRIVAEIAELWRILQTAVTDEQARPVICVLDALDECQDNHRLRLISMLCQFYNNIDRATSVPGKLKILVTSRPYEDIEHHFGRIATSLPSIRLRGEDESDQLREEINLVVRWHVQEIARELPLAPTTATALERKLTAMEHRTYLWLFLAIDHVRKMFSQSLRPDQVSIELLPKSVEEAYEQILSRVDCEQVEYVRTILRIILGARRPLTLGEMTLALDIATSKTAPQCFSDLKMRENRLRSHIKHWCGLFVSINHSRLYLVHQTAKEFLLRSPTQASTNSGRWKHCLSATNVELEMAQVYITYLCFTDFEIQGPWRDFWLWSSRVLLGLTSYSSRLQEQGDHNQELFKLAAESWADHWRKAEPVADRAIKDKVWMLYHVHCQLFSSVVTRGSQTGLTDLTLAAYNGHVDIAHHILSKSETHIDSRDEEEQGRTALIWAADMGHYDLVTLLIQAGANIHIEAGWYGNALYAAASRGHDQVVQILLKAGADADSKGMNGTALHVATLKDRKQVVPVLLTAGANIDAQTGEEGSALQIASRCGHTEIVRILITADADVNLGGGYYGNALQAASYTGHAAACEMLLAAGADVNATGGCYGNALQAASCAGHEELVAMLIAAGAELTARGGLYRDALTAASIYSRSKIVSILLAAEADGNERFDIEQALADASRKGYVEIVRVLLAARANPDAKEYEIPLYIASENGHREIVKILLAAGAHVNGNAPRCKHALETAVLKDEEETVKMLLAAGADVNARDGDHESVLEIASRKGRMEIVKILLAAGPDPHLHDLDGILLNAFVSGKEEIVVMLRAVGATFDVTRDNFSNLLQIASRKGYEKGVALLLAAGADVNRGDQYGATALHDASSGGHENVVKLLLAAGADVNRENQYGATALHDASCYGHKDIVETLITAGANVNARAKGGITALQNVSYYGHKDIVETLITAGADVNAIDGDGNTALYLASDDRDKDLVKILLAAGADVNIRGQSGTALELASGNGDLEIVTMLLTAGADVSQRKKSESALWDAHYYENPEIVQILLGAGAKWPEDLDDEAKEAVKRYAVLEVPDDLSERQPAIPGIE